MGGFGQSVAASPSPAARSVPQPDAGGALGGLIPGGLAGGLGSLLERLRSAGQGDVANSWVNPGPNQPIQPGQLGSALGQTTVSELARQAGMSEQELLAQLSRVLPDVVDKLTPGLDAFPSRRRSPELISAPDIDAICWDGSLSSRHR